MIHYYRRMLNIQRLAGTPKHRGYDLAQHSYFTALIFLDLCNILGKSPSAGQLDLVLKHDLLEVFTADLPYPIKNLNEATKEAWATIEQEAVFANILAVPLLGEYTDKSLETGLGDLYGVFKAADLLELWTFCMEEQVMGNCTVPMESVIKKCEELFIGMGDADEALGKAVLGLMHQVIAAGRPMSQNIQEHGLKAKIVPEDHQDEGGIE